jgi:TPR repeat protein
MSWLPRHLRAAIAIALLAGAGVAMAEEPGPAEEPAPVEVPAPAKEPAPVPGVIHRGLPEVAQLLASPAGAQVAERLAAAAAQRASLTPEELGRETTLRYLVARLHLDDPGSGEAPAHGSETEWFVALSAACDQGYKLACSPNELKGDIRFLARKHGDLCDQGDPLGCVVRGWSRSRIGTPEASLALFDFALACEAGFARGCLELGGVMANGVGMPPDELGAAPFFEQACLAGWPAGCRAWADRVDRGVGAAPDEALATVIYGLACEQGDAPACTRLAVAAHLGAGLPESLDRADALYEIACQAGDGPACLARGKLRERAGDESMALLRYRAACKQQVAEGCLRTGGLLAAQGQLPDAVEPWEKACDLGHAQACVQLAHLLDGDGPWLPKPAEAVVRWAQACEAGQTDACGVAAMRLMGPTAGVTSDPNRALRLLVSACDDGSIQACLQAEKWWDRAPRPPEPGSVKAALDRACAGGDKAACKAASRMAGP